MSVTFRKIRADEIQPGMMVARHRSHSYKRVGSTEQLALTTRIVFADTPFALCQSTRHGATWWVREETPEQHPDAPSIRRNANAGQCLSRCVCCDGPVIVLARMAPTIMHGPERGTGEPCPREGWPVLDAIHCDD